MTPMSFLPVDVYAEILIRLPVVQNVSSITALIACCQVNSQLRNAATIPSIWQPHYLARYLHSSEDKEMRRKAELDNDWRLMTIERLRFDAIALKALDDIVHHTSDRTARAREVCSLSFDVFDALFLETEYQRLGNGEAPSGLTKCYWARQLTGLIARRETLSVWTTCLTRNNSNSSSGIAEWIYFERAIGGLSSFFGTTSTQVCRYICLFLII